ncbi:MAG: acetolactate synthase small subunit [Acidobacteria bacterium]|nr:acetolactate synthase small subunit [Acidobacteriota bacterium]
MKPHTFVVTVEDLPGVLNRISSLFRRRNYNIDSLTVGHTERPGVSRMTFVVLTDTPGAERFAANLYKLVNVISVADITNTPAVYRDLAMIKVAAPQERRPEIVHLVEVFRARIVDLSPESLTIEITGGEDKIDGLLDVLRPYGVLEMARTGRLAMTRAARANASAPAPGPVADTHDPQVSYSV